jgi:hypothetical protein
MVCNFKGRGKKTSWGLRCLGRDPGSLSEHFSTIQSNVALEEQYLKQQEEWLFLDFLNIKWWHNYPSKRRAAVAQQQITASQDTWIFQ